MKVLTVFTPTYNRAYILPKLFHSLCEQKNQNFVWLIVDDGSTDNTEKLVKEWIAEARISIEYFKQPNGGKMRAHNKGVKETNTPLFFCIDSDDYLADNVVERIIITYSEIERDSSICGILAKRNIINRKVSNSFPNVELLSLHELYALGFKGDTSIVFRTSVIRQYPFPEIDGEKFVTEGYIYDQIDQNYKYLLKDEFWMICEYQEDGYTTNSLKLIFNNPKGWSLYYSQYYSYYANTIRDKIKYIGYYIASSVIARKRIFDTIRESPSMIICLLSIPAGLYLHWRWVKELKHQN